MNEPIPYDSKLKNSLKIEGGILIEAGKEIKAFEELAKAVEVLQQEIG